MKSPIIIMAVVLLMFCIPSVQARGINAGDGLYEYNLCNCREDGADYFPENRTFRFITTPLGPEDSNVSYGLGMFQAKFEVNRSPTESQVKSFTMNGGFMIDMMKNVSIMEGEFQKDSISPIVPCVFIEAYFYLFVDHSVQNEGPIRHYMTNGTEYHPHPALIEVTPVIISVGGSSSEYTLLYVTLAVSLVAIAIILVVRYKNRR